MNVCVMDSPELKELYNSVKDTGESYESIKNLVNVWQLRKFNRNKNFDFTELPTKQDIENLLKERDVPNIDSVFVQEYSQEMKNILAKAPRDSQGRLLAPNGKPSNLTERQYTQVRTKAFKRWFGDWENNPANASKVVDENGEPLVVYHGTNAEFTVFNNSKSDSSYKGFYFTDSKEMAGSYKGDILMPVFLNIRDYYKVNASGKSWNNISTSIAGVNSNSALEWLENIVKQNSLELEQAKRGTSDILSGKYIKNEKRIKEVQEFLDNLGVTKLYNEYKNVINSSPLSTVERAIKYFKLKSIEHKAAKLFNDNYYRYRETNFVHTRDLETVFSDRDGIIINDVIDYGSKVDNALPNDVYIVYNPSQIKSATDNIGTFSTEDNRIDRFDTILNENNKLTEEQKQFILNALPNLDTFIEDIYAVSQEKYKKNPYYQLFVQIIDTLKVNNIPVSIVKDFDIDSIAQIRRTNFKEAIIKVNPKMLFDYLTQFDRDKMKSKTVRVILHELVHSITADVVASHPSWSEFKGFDEAQSKFNAEIDRLYNITVREIGNEEWYGLENKAEFIAEALTDQAFQTRLSKLKYNKEQTIFERITNSIKDLFYRLFYKHGIDISNSVFEDILKVSQEYLDYAKFGINKNINTYGWGNTINKFEQIKSTNIKQESKQLGLQYTNHSGGAVGSDSYWGEIGEKYGITSKHYHAQGSKTPKGNTSVSKEDLLEADIHLLKANETLKRKFPASNEYVNNLLRRNWQQVKNADAVFAISTIKDNIVEGGTGWAVQMAIDNNKPVYVFDQNTNKWYKYNAGTWVEVETPILTKNFAGIGTRNLSESGKKAIEDVYRATFNSTNIEQTPIPENLKETPETVAQDINQEEQSSYVKRNVKAEIISQLEEELKDFGTFERRQDRINFILRFIRNQKKAYFKEHQQILQNKINDPSTTERDRKNYQKLLNNLDADEIFANNIDTIINRAKQALSPESVSRTLSRKLLEKGYSDFNTLTKEQQEQKITEDFNYRTQEFAKIQKHWNSLMEDVKSTLRVVDGYVIDFVKSKEDDNKDNQSEGEGTVKDNWMYEARKIDQRESLSKKVKTIINNIPILDRNGKQEIDDLGYPRFMNAEEVTSTLFYELSNARSCEHFWQKLNNLPNKKPWSKIIVDTINKEGNYEIKSQFYQNFRKESIPYWSQIWTKKGKITTKKINRGGKNNKLLEDWMDNIESGTILTPNSIYGENGKPNVEKAAENLKTLGKLVIEFKSKGNKLGNTNNLNTLLDLINSVGIEITTDELTRSIQNYPQKTEKIFNSLHTIFSKVSDNKTILSTTINNVVVYDNIVEKLDTQYNLLATLIDFDVKSIELQSFRELGDTYQSVSAPSYLGTLISNLTNTENEEEFKQFFEREFGQYTQFKDKETGRIKNEWLSILYNKPEERKNLERKVVIHSNRKEFNKQTPQEYLLGMLVEFIQPDINYAYYALPLLSDADSEEFIKFVRYTDGSVKNERGESISYKSIINEKLAQAIKDEYDRILMVNRRLKSNAETITTFDSRGTKFTYFPELNDITVNADGVINGEGENKLFKDALDYLTNTKQDLLPFINKVIGQIMDANSKEFISDAFNIANVELISEKLNMTKDSVPKLLDNFFYNYALANINMIQLLTTDLAYYKNTIDFFKRFKEVYASTLKLDTTAKFVGENGDEVKGSKTQSVMILKDNIIKSPSYDSIKSILEGRVQAGAITTKQMNDLLEAYSKVNVADAQGYRTLKSYRKLMVMAGRWNKKLERSYQRLKNNTFDFDDFNSIFNTIKPFCYSQRSVASQVVYTNESTNETVEYGNLKVPIQIKDSEVVLLAMYSTLVSPLNKSEKLVGLNKFMDDNDIDIVVFESGVKAGGQGIIDINNVENTYEALKNTVLTNGEKNPFYIHNISTEDFGIQVETPDHLVDVEQLIGSQIKKLIQGDIDVNNIGVTFRLNEGIKDREKTMNKQEMLSHINKLLSSNIIDSFEDLREEFSSLDKVAETLQKELKGNSRYTKDLIVACSLVETTDQIGNVIKEFALPLNDATQFSRIENLLTSLFKNQVIKQKIRGGSPIQFSCYGVSDDLHIEMTGEGTERRIKWVDCYMPAYTKEFFKYYMTTDENGNQFVDINKVPEELKRLVGYRVPTEARYSMLPLRIKGFLPSSEGSKIMLPADITTIAGSDFDKLSMLK